MRQFSKRQWLFWRELFKNPRAIGAVFPSARELGFVMAQQISKDNKGLIVELGAGTGSITRALLQRFPEEQLVIIELSEKLYHHLKETFPKTKIILGDAVNLPKLLVPYQEPVTAIVSSLPLRSMNKNLVRNIQQAAHDTLDSGGYFIQFTYDPRHNAAQLLPDFKYIGYKKVWRNFPPARVDIYKKC